MTKEQKLIDELQEYLDIEDTSGIDLYPEEVQMCIDALATKIELNKRDMTPDIIKEYMIFEDECVKKNFTFKSLINAREKQVAKKPRNIEVLGESFFEDEVVIKYGDCAICGFNVHNDICDYCPYCGQKIDWSEADE